MQALMTASATAHGSFTVVHARRSEPLKRLAESMATSMAPKTTTTSLATLAVVVRSPISAVASARHASPSRITAWNPALLVNRWLGLSATTRFARRVTLASPFR